MPLRIVLWVKIAVTAVLWCVPLLLFRPEWFAEIGYPQAPYPVLFVRLLRVAYLALGVGYVLGLRALNRGGSAAKTVTVGIVSNGLACLTLLIYLARGEFGGWGFWAQAHIWASIAATGLVTLGLLTARKRPA